jgi:uncharacterized membrane protein
MSPVAIAHVAFGVAALAFGTVNAVRPKGTASHRLIGHTYYLAMLGLNGTAFGIYDFFGSFGLFHWLAVLSLATTLAAMIPVLLRRPRTHWKVYHGYFMLYSYMGLLAATAAEIAVRVPVLWTTDSPAMYLLGVAMFASVCVTVAGCVVIPRVMRRHIVRDQPARAQRDVLVNV